MISDVAPLGGQTIGKATNLEEAWWLCKRYGLKPVPMNDPSKVGLADSKNGAKVWTAWIQTSSATVDLKAAITSARASAGVLHPRVFLGRLFIRFATSFSHVWLAPFRSVPLGMN